LVKRTEGYFVTAEAMQEGNPTLILERGDEAALPPTLVIQGIADNNVTPAMQEHFVAVYRAAGGEVQYEVFPTCRTVSVTRLAPRQTVRSRS
jgi:acetyl esterase